MRKGSLPPPQRSTRSSSADANSPRPSAPPRGGLCPRCSCARASARRRPRDPPERGGRPGGGVEAPKDFVGDIPTDEKRLGDVIWKEDTSTARRVCRAGRGAQPKWPREIPLTTSFFCRVGLNGSVGRLEPVDTPARLRSETVSRDILHASRGVLSRTPRPRGLEIEFGRTQRSFTSRRTLARASVPLRGERRQPSDAFPRAPADSRVRRKAPAGRDHVVRRERPRRVPPPSVRARSRCVHRSSASRFASS